MAHLLKIFHFFLKATLQFHPLQNIFFCIKTIFFSPKVCQFFNVIYQNVHTKTDNTLDEATSLTLGSVSVTLYIMIHHLDQVRLSQTRLDHCRPISFQGQSRSHYRSASIGPIPCFVRPSFTVKHFVIINAFRYCQVPVRELQSTRISKQENDINKFFACHKHLEKQTQGIQRRISVETIYQSELVDKKDKKMQS